MRKKILLVLYLFFMVMSGYANDTSGSVLPTGGVVFEKQNGIQMVTEALYIRPGQIEVNYLFENTTDKDISTRVFFPLPPMPAVEQYLGDEAHDYHFKLWVNGKERTYQTHWTVTQGNTDITAEVADIFSRPEEIISERERSKRLQNIPAEKRSQLLDKKIIEWGWLLDSELGEIENWKMPDNTPWEKQLSYSWLQVFPANKTSAIRHTYQPTSMHSNTGIPFSKCLDKKSPEYLSFMTQDPEDALTAYNNGDRFFAQDYLEYILTTAENWQGPIANFNLLVESPFKSVGCFNGESFYGEKYYTLNLQNYTPGWDMSVDFVYHNYTVKSYTPATLPELFRIDGPANLRKKPNGQITGQLADKTYVWGFPGKKTGQWYPVLQNEKAGYTHRKNLIKVF